MAKYLNITRGVNIFLPPTICLSEIRDLQTDSKSIQLLDILNENSLEQIVKKPTRGYRPIDLELINIPSIVNKVEPMTTIGNADNGIVYADHHNF